MLSLIDTDVMIDLSRGNADAANYLDSLSDPAISIVTAQELIVGARDKRDLYAIDSLVSTYRRFTLTQRLASLRMSCSIDMRSQMACAHSTL